MACEDEVLQPGLPRPGSGLWSRYLEVGALIKSTIDARSSSADIEPMWNRFTRLTLLGKFLLVGTPITLAIGMLMAAAVGWELTRIQIDDSARQAGFQVDRLVTPLLLPEDLQAPIRGLRYHSLRRQLAESLPAEVVRIKIWAADGTLLFSDEPELVGRRFPANGSLAEAVAGSTVSRLEDMGADPENASEAGYERLLEVYTPIRAPWSGSIEGVYEVYRDARALQSRVDSMRVHVWLGSLLGFFALFASLFLLIRRASRQLVGHNEEILHANELLREAYDATIEGLARALDKRDEETEGHSRRVTHLTERLLARLGLPPEEILHGRRGALLHDIGKLGIPDSILLKPGPLTEEEWDVMRTHPTLAHEMLQPIEHLRPALDVPYCHHERWDGGGYPRGLAGEAIPLAARAFALVDVWDALSSDRPYRPAWPQEQVMTNLAAEAGLHFDPALVPVFAELIAEYVQSEGLPTTQCGAARRAWRLIPSARAQEKLELASE